MQKLRRIQQHSTERISPPHELHTETDPRVNLEKNRDTWRYKHAAMGEDLDEIIKKFEANKAEYLRKSQKKKSEKKPEEKSKEKSKEKTENYTKHGKNRVWHVKRVEPFLTEKNAGVKRNRTFKRKRIKEKRKKKGKKYTRKR